MAVKNKPNEISITRIYDAPVKAVWDAWVDPKQVAQWWGPRGFTLTTKSKDVRAGGNWIYTMHGPDGTDYPNVTLFHEVERYSLLVYDHGGSEDRPPMFRVTVRFTEAKGKTTMNMTMAFPTAEEAANTKKFIKMVGGNSTWDRLAEFLEKESSGQEKFVINRSFETSAEMMFEMWTDPKHFVKWLPPTGFEMKFLRADIKAGGSCFYVIKNGADTEMYGRIQYREITRPTRIVYTQQFCDEKENLSRHPMAPTWPASMLTTVTFNEEEDGLTRVTIVWEVDGQATPEEIATFKAEKPGMTQGWTGSFDKLEALIDSSKR